MNNVFVVESHFVENCPFPEYDYTVALRAFSTRAEAERFADGVKSPREDFDGCLITEVPFGGEE